MKNALAGKVKTLRSLSRIAKRLKHEGKKIVLCHGVFDLLHPGHVRHFLQAKQHGDILIVTVTADKFVKKGPGRPIFREVLRAEVLSAIASIDYVSIIASDSAVAAIEKIKPDFYVKGPDYKKRKVYKEIPRKLVLEEKALYRVGGKVLFTDDIVFSSSALINAHLDVYPKATKQYLDVLKRTYSVDDILDQLLQLSKQKILVIGDAIIDQYHYCLPLGKSSKEPVMVHRYVSEESFPGGAIATANHAAALSRDITLVTVLGKEKSFEPFILRNLKKEIRPKFFYQPGIPTIVKRRYLDTFTTQKLFQVSYLREELLSAAVEKNVLDFLKDSLPSYDLVMVNDFGHGFLSPAMIDCIGKKATYIALNVQANSANYGFNLITKYRRAEFVCIDEMEIRLATHDKHGDLHDLMKRICKVLKCRFLTVTRGPEGSVSLFNNTSIVSPALTDRVIDRVGAGDALFAMSAVCSVASMDPQLVAFIGNVAGALKVQIVGNKKPVELSDIIRFVTRLLK